MTCGWHAWLLAAVAALAAGCESSAGSPVVAHAADAQPDAIPVTVAAVSLQRSARVVHFVGTLYGNEEVTLSNQVEGQIKSLSVDLGDQVARGQVLAQIDDDQWLARLREAEATLAKARADEDRGRQLVGRQVISTQEYESMKTHAEVAQAQRDTLTVTIRHARVESPIRGAVARRFVSVGEYVRAGSQLFSLIDDDPLKLRGDVPERVAHELQVGQTVEVNVDAYPDVVFGGRLTRISPASNPQNRSVSVEALIDNETRRLKPGFYAHAGVVVRTDDRALMIPQEALITFAGVSKVFVIKTDRAEEREVHTGTRGTAGRVEVLDGLKPDELVATSGLTKLQTGATVTVKPSPPAGTEPPS